MKLPGSKKHQRILQVLLDLFKKDSNVEAFIILGSLATGNWDNYSDMDLDVIVANDNEALVHKEIGLMLKSLSNFEFKILTAFAEFKNEQVIIFDTLDRISIRFHTLKDTNPAILDSMRILYGKHTEKYIRSVVVEKEAEVNLELLNNKFLELSMYVPISLKRGKVINAQFFLNKMRQTLISIYVKSQRFKREFDFEANASLSLKKELYTTYAACEKSEIIKAFNKLLDVYKNNLKEISNGKIKLSDGQDLLIKEVRNY